MTNRDRSVKVTVSDMRKICPSCADKMEKDGVKHFYLDMASADMGLPSGTVSDEVSVKLRRFAIGESHNIDGVEIFASGTWNGDTYSDKDLDAMVAAFKATKDALKPYLKLGHSEDQALLAEDSLPAAGWVSNVYRRGHKLLADFRDIPAKVFDLIRAKAYKRVSSEIFVNMNVAGKRYPFALKAVALLGGETPAVQTLDDVHALYALDSTVLAYAKQAETREYQFDSAKNEQEATMPEEKDMLGKPTPAQTAVAEGKSPNLAAAEKDNALPAAHDGTGPMNGAAPEGDECYKQLKAAHMEIDGYKKQMAAEAPKQAQMEGAISSYKLKIEELDKELAATRESLSKVSGELNKIYAEKTKAEVDTQVDRFVQDKKVMPSQAAALKALLFHAKESGVKKFKLGDKEVDSVEALLREFVDNGSNGLHTEPKSESGKNIAVDPFDGASVDVKVKDFMAKTGEKSYRTAYIAVAKELSQGGSKNG